MFLAGSGKILSVKARHRHGRLLSFRLPDIDRPPFFSYLEDDFLAVLSGKINAEAVLQNPELLGEHLVIDLQQIAVTWQVQKELPGPVGKGRITFAFGVQGRNPDTCRIE